MNDPSSRDQDNMYLWVLLVQTRDAIINARQQELSRYNTSSYQGAVLFTIEDIGDEATAAEIARRLLRKPHTISEILSRMEKKGLIRKLKNLRRKDQVRIVLTEKGREVYRQTTKRESINKIMSVLSKEEHKQLMSYMKKLRDEALKEIGIEHKLPFPPSQ